MSQLSRKLQPPNLVEIHMRIKWYRSYMSRDLLSTSVRSMATKLDRVVGFNAGLLSTKSRNLLFKCSNKVTKSVIKSFLHDSRLSNLTEGWLMIRSQISNSKATHPSDHAVTRGQVTNELYYLFIVTKSISTKLD